MSKFFEHFKTASKTHDEALAEKTVSVKQEKLAVAIENYQKALEEGDPSPRNIANTHSNLGNAYRDKGDSEHALEQYDIALTLWPDHRRASDGKVMVYLAKITKTAQAGSTHLQMLPLYIKAEEALEVAIHNNKKETAQAEDTIIKELNNSRLLKLQQYKNEVSSVKSSLSERSLNQDNSQQPATPSRIEALEKEVQALKETVEALAEKLSALTPTEEKQSGWVASISPPSGRQMGSGL